MVGQDEGELGRILHQGSDGSGGEFGEVLIGGGKDGKGAGRPVGEFRLNRRLERQQPGSKSFRYRRHYQQWLAFELPATTVHGGMISANGFEHQV